MVPVESLLRVPELMMMPLDPLLRVPELMMSPDVVRVPEFVRVPLFSRVPEFVRVPLFTRVPELVKTAPLLITSAAPESISKEPPEGLLPWPLTVQVTVEFVHNPPMSAH